MIVLRLLVPIFALFSVFFFPWQVTLVLLLAASLILPVLGVVIGAFADLIYYSPGAGMPFFLLMGIAATGLALLVHRFVKTRIME